MSRYPFGSPQWLGFLHGVIRERVAAGLTDGRDLTFSMCEVFLNAPQGIANDGSRLVWSCVVEGGNVDFRESERDDVRLKVVADYEACLPVCRYDTRGDADRAAEMAKMMATLREAGHLRIEMSGEGGAGSMPSVHDATARVTA